MRRQIPTFRTGDELYYSDTCEALKLGVERKEVQLSARARGLYPGEPFPTDELDEIRTVGYWNANHDQSWGLDWHVNEGIEITYVDRGRVTSGLEGVNHYLKSGDLTITRPWQRHRLGNPHVTACRLHWLILDVGVRRPNQEWKWPNWLLLSPEERSYFSTILRQNEQPVWRVTDEIAFYFQRLSEVVDRYEEPTGNSQLKLYTNGLLIALTTMLREQNPALTPSLSSSQRAVELFLASLPEHSEHDWTVDSMAQACGLKRRRFSYYCQQITNLSPMAYLAQCRIERSCELLRSHPELNITDIAFQSGFASSQYFATVFRAHIGVSPLSYRNTVSVDPAV
ncbi:MAG: AraC family transcriptional regulator, partial [Thermomicrobiales bacterium]